VVGLVPSSYVFDHGGMYVRPQMLELPEPLAIAFLTFAHVGIAALPALFMRTLREQLATAQVNQLVQTWHFRRLGDDLIRAAG
jgi:hypothetical protein